MAISLLLRRLGAYFLRQTYDLTHVRRSMREAAGQSIKSSVYHSWTRDTRDDRLLGTRGAYAKFFHELAGAGGDTSFYKAEAQGQLARSLFSGVVSCPGSLDRGSPDHAAVQTLSLAARSGAMWHFGGKSCFSDRFQLGGPVSVRMFRMNGMGPHDGGGLTSFCYNDLGLTVKLADSLGGNLFWSAGLSLISDIPRKPHWPVKTHLFVNAGRLDVMDKCT